MATKKQPSKRKAPEAVTYHFNRGVSVDATETTPEYRYEGDSSPGAGDGEEVRAEELPPHMDLKGLIAVGAIRPVEDAD